MIWTEEQLQYLKDNYNKMSFDEIAENLEINHWFVESMIYDLKLLKPKSNNHYTINTKYFHIIGTEDKAYWLGFLWCDGYVTARERKYKNNDTIRIEYDLNFRLIDSDYKHLEKFRQCVSSTHPIKILKNNGSFKTSRGETYHCKYFVSNKEFVRPLYDKYGIIPNRHDPTKIVNAIPEHLHKHFIRGVLDGDGTFNKYTACDHSRGKITMSEKYGVNFGGSIELLRFIEKHLIKNGVITPMERKIHKRHDEENRDGFFRDIKICGINDFVNTLYYLYDDATIYLDRKYEKYIKYMKELNLK